MCCLCLAQAQLAILDDQLLMQMLSELRAQEVGAAAAAAAQVNNCLPLRLHVAKALRRTPHRVHGQLLFAVQQCLRLSSSTAFKVCLHGICIYRSSTRMKLPRALSCCTCLRCPCAMPPSNTGLAGAANIRGHRGLAPTLRRSAGGAPGGGVSAAGKRWYRNVPNTLLRNPQLSRLHKH